MMNKTIAKLDGDKVYEGLRIPPTLDTLATVTFVLTQEPGKLKPKDLKIAIERNRAEREMRAEEQRKIREQGGGAGMLDLRGILAEEKLNSSQGDPFKRQLREMGFLADVDEVEKQEIEKEFRISEDYLGSNILSHDEINIVYKQRAIAQLHKKRTEWRVIQARQHTTNFAPIHQHVKAGASAPISRQILKEVNPLFDSNRNDVWGKRMNTLRRFISLVSKWLIRKRVTERMNKVTQTFADNGAFTREEVLAFIKKENELALKQNNGGGGNSNSNNINGHDKKSVDFNLSHELAQDTGLPKRPNSVAEMVFQAPNEILTTRLHNEKVIKEMKNAIPITPELARRVLFPVCTMDNNNSKGSRKEMKPTSLTNLIQFDDRAFYQLKVRPNYITMNYKPHTIPPVPLYFPPCEEKSLRTGAPEELALRPPADEAKEDSPEEKEILTQFLINTPPEPVYMAALRILPPPIIPELSSDQQTEEIILAHRESLKIPKYLQPPSNSSGHISSSATTTSSLSNINLQNKVLSSQWTASDINFFTALPSMRLYNPLPRRCELDADWTLRPDNNKDKLEYQPDPSLRTKLCSKPGFLSANVYLLANHESRNKDTPPPPGPTLSDYYCPDQDRHISGFIHYQHDHLRGIVEKDPDISGLQSKQDKADYLTDSESDNDDNDIEYQKKNKPTMEKVRKLLHPPKKVEPVAVAPVDPKAKGGKGAADKKGAPPPVAAPVTPAPTVEDTGAGDTSIILGEGEKKEEQVELLRDRKILDYESTVLRTRQKKHDVIASRMVELSKQSRCILQQLPVQMPFHSYEDEVYKIIESQIPPLPTSHVESNHLRLSLNDSLPNLSATLMSSPNK